MGSMKAFIIQKSREEVDAQGKLIRVPIKGRGETVYIETYEKEVPVSMSDFEALARADLRRRKRAAKRARVWFGEFGDESKWIAVDLAVKHGQFGVARLLVDKIDPSSRVDYKRQEIDRAAEQAAEAAKAAANVGTDGPTDPPRDSAQ